jgi:nitrate/nitrite transport system ATP-binding protein
MGILELHQVSKSYGATHVLSKVDLSVEKGEFVAIVGFSGAGKSTLISLLAGLIRADSGKVTFADKPVTGPGPERGVVFQNYSLLPWLSAYGNVHFAVESVLTKLSAAEQRAQTERFITMVGLSHARDRKPGQLSGGMRQRVSLARALAADPEVLLMDEPLGALDALTRATMQDEIERIGRSAGKTIVLVTNDVDEAVLLADRIIPLGAGPGATLGPAMVVDIERPRDRRELNHDPRFQRIRREVTEYLLSTRRKPRPASIPAPVTAPKTAEALP